MDIVFEIEAQNEYRTDFVGMADGTPVGHVWLYDRYRAEIRAIWREDKERLTQRDFMDAFCRFMKEQGYTELTMTSSDEDSGKRLGFCLEDRDTSGWYPKYTFRREL